MRVQVPNEALHAWQQQRSGKEHIQDLHGGTSCHVVSCHFMKCVKVVQVPNQARQQQRRGKQHIQHLHGGTPCDVM